MKQGGWVSGSRNLCYHAIVENRGKGNRAGTRVGAVMMIVITMLQIYIQLEELGF